MNKISVNHAPQVYAIVDSIQAKFAYSRGNYAVVFGE
jgi:hypothetical protein